MPTIVKILKIIIIPCLITFTPVSFGEQPMKEISSITFGNIPPSTNLTGQIITLDGPVSVSNDISVAGEIGSTGGGLRFPDGSVQATSATSFMQSFSANNGLYQNRIPNLVPSALYTEICFKAGSVLADIHAVVEGTVGGNCLPGDIGWIIERNERVAQTWELAKAECLTEGMRLPEPFEYKYSRINAANFGLNDMTNNFEWSSNTASILIRDSIPGGWTVGAMGLNLCSNGFGHPVATNVNGGTEAALEFRCAL